MLQVSFERQVLEIAVACFRASFKSFKSFQTLKC